MTTKTLFLISGLVEACGCVEYSLTRRGAGESSSLGGHIKAELEDIRGYYSCLAKDIGVQINANLEYDWVGTSQVVEPNNVINPNNVIECPNQ